MTPSRLSSRQRLALELLRRSREPAFITTDVTAICDGVVQINWRTAYALFDKGEVNITNYGEEDAEVHLV